MRKRIIFFAAHLLSPSVASGGDVLFCQLAARIAKLRPDWEIIGFGPDFARQELERFFERVVTISTSRSEGSQGSPVSVAVTWLRRLKIATTQLHALKPDLVHSTGDFFIDVRPVLSAKRNLSFKWSGVVHHINEPPLTRRNDPLVAAASYALQRGSLRALRAADAISVLNSGVQSDLKALGFKAERLHVVGAGIDLDRFPLIPARDRKRRAVWVNRLEPTKGLHDIPDIIKHLPRDVIVDVVGRGPDVHVARLRLALRAAGLEDRCFLHGFLPEDRLRDVMRHAAVFFSCSYEEGWGISIAEALAMGLPCIAYDLPSHREIFGDEIRRVPVGDTAAFAQEISAAVQRECTDEHRAARREVAARYSLDACARRQEQVFASLMA